MAPLAKTLAVAAMLAASTLVAAGPVQLEARQYQDPNSELVMNEPACDFYRCYIYWVPGSQVAVNWLNPPSSGNVQVDLMTNNNTEVAYNVGTSPSISTTCDAGSGYGQPGPNGAQCGGFVFQVPSSWNPGNYSGLRAMLVQNQEIASYTDMINIVHNDTTKNDVPLSIVSGSTGAASSTAAAASSTGVAAATTTGAGGSRATETAAKTSPVNAASATSTPNNNAAVTSNANAALLAVAAALVAGIATLL